MKRRRKHSVRLRNVAAPKPSAKMPADIPLPMLLDGQERKFIILYCFSGFPASDCYRWAFETDATQRSCAVTACLLLKEQRILQALLRCAEYSDQFPMSSRAISKILGL